MTRKSQYILQGILLLMASIITLIRFTQTDMTLTDNLVGLVLTFGLLTAVVLIERIKQ